MRKKASAQAIPAKGSAHSGIITGIQPYGVFVQLGRHSGLCHFSHVSPKIDRSKLHKGQSVFVRVLEVRLENKLSLSLEGVAQMDHQDVIVIRNSQDRSKVMADLRARDLAAIYAERKKHALASKKLSAKQNAQAVPNPRTLSEIKEKGDAQTTHKKVKKHSAKRPATSKKPAKGKVKRRSVWTISGGGIETNRRKH